MENLRELNDKLEFIKQQRKNGYASVDDVSDVIEKLKVKVSMLAAACCYECLFTVLIYWTGVVVCTQK